ncbi:MAG: hypothetical protein LJE83_14330 [Gammaproteobacteria bacterium]|nr:hypothetical protein [Gammaproteobacteria bacterium]
MASLPAFSATLNVPASYPTIQAAIDAASSGDVVEVDTGTYQENIVLRDGIDVRGIEAARTFLVARDDTLPVVQANSINNVLFGNFTINGSTNGVTILNSGITLTSNIFDSVLGTAISVTGFLSNVEILNNVFRGNYIAISRFIPTVSITNNIFTENTFTIISDTDQTVDPNFNVSYNCFHNNNDLDVNGSDGALGTSFQTGDPLFVDVTNNDFHLQQNSICIDAGTGVDVIDDTVADIGAYGGDYADAIPFPVSEPTATDSSTSGPDVFNITLDWQANLAYLVTNTVTPGSYKVWYQRNQSGPPYNGTDAGNGTLPSPVTVASGTSYTLMDLQPDATAAPGVPVLVSAAPQNQSVVLQWNIASGATGYRVHYGVGAVTENSIDVGDATGYTVTGLENGTSYVFAVGAIARAVYYLAVTAVDSTADKNESDYSPATAISIGNPVEGMLSSELAATPDEVAPYPDLPDKGCFIATAAFGADWIAEVKVLRDFRDQYLLTNAPGRLFVSWYYRHGPVAAKYLNQNAELKPLVRTLLWPLVVMAAFMLDASMALKVWVVTLTLILILMLIGRHRSKLGLSRGEGDAL